MTETTTPRPMEIVETLRSCTGRHPAALIAALALAEIERLNGELSESQSWTDEDKPLPEDEAIHEAHPLRSKDYDTYAEALRMVGAKRSKYALVDLVNWLLHRVKGPK